MRWGRWLIAAGIGLITVAGMFDLALGLIGSFYAEWILPTFFVLNLGSVVLPIAGLWLLLNNPFRHRRLFTRAGMSMVCFAICVACQLDLEYTLNFGVMSAIHRPLILAIYLLIFTAAWALLLLEVRTFVSATRRTLLTVAAVALLVALAIADYRTFHDLYEVLTAGPNAWDNFVKRPPPTRWDIAFQLSVFAIQNVAAAIIAFVIFRSREMSEAFRRRLAIEP